VPTRVVAVHWLPIYRTAGKITARASSALIAMAPLDDRDIARLVACGAAEHPGIAEPPGLRDRLATGTSVRPESLDARAADLYLAAACVAGDATAIARFDESLSATVGPVLARFRVPVSEYTEIIQRVRIALLVRDQAGACCLADYSGRGDLRAYVRSVAARIVLKRLERETAPLAQNDDLLALLPSANDSQELALLKQRCRDDVRAGFASALAALTPGERTLLRQHYIDGLTVDMLGAFHQVHRSTCARWLEATRLKVLRGVRNHLRAKLGLDDAELESAVALVRSQLDLSLVRHLAAGASAGETG
jgi:RNA polymerase sigma-70 factor (ECF subfamily)